MANSNNEVAAVLVRQYLHGRWIPIGIEFVPEEQDEYQYAKYLSKTMSDTGWLVGLYDPSTRSTYTSVSLSSGPLKVSPFTEGLRTKSWIASEYRKLEDDITAMASRGI